MRYRVIGRNEQTQTEVIRDIVCDSPVDAEAFAVLEGIQVERIEPLPDTSGLPGPGDPTEPLRGPAGPVRSKPVYRQARFGPAPGTGLPAPLDDPLRALRRFLGWLLLLDLVLVAGGLVYVFTRRTDSFGPMQLLVSVILLNFPMAFAFWRLLPNRPVNAFYLRSFRYDAGTSAVRRALLAALGRPFRLSGIRDPRRRSIKVLRYLTVFIFALRYATPKYLNLEAGADWKRRLWRSLGDARLAVIDVSDLTPFVVQEIQLGVRCLGLERILFVGDTTKDLQAWQAELRPILSRLPDEGPVHVAIWDASREGRRAFEAEVRRFAAQVPAGPAGLRLDAFPLDEPSAVIDAPADTWGGWMWVELGLGLALAWALLTAFFLARDRAGPDRSWLWLVPVLGYALFELWSLLLYLKECGTLRERCLTLATFGFAGAWMGFSVVGALHVASQVRITAQQMKSSTNLKRLAIAMGDYANDENTLPLADGVDASERPPRRPPVSWRVTILPYLDDPDARAVFRAYDRRQPWDSPHNLALVERMPRVYALPGTETKTPAGHTYYRVFVSSPTVHPQAVFVQGTPTPIMEIGNRDGTSRTILVVEAAEAVPWTKPDELAYDPNGPLPRLGGHFPDGKYRGFRAVLVNGGIRTFPPDMPEAVLRGWITRNGNEQIPDE
jgi:hypothetical protein